LGLKGVHDLRVEWLVATVNRGVEAQPVLEKPRTGNGGLRPVILRVDN